MRRRVLSVEKVGVVESSLYGVLSMSNVVAYYRVSTDRQRRSGLGIEAQRTAVHRFAEAEGLKITSEYVEAETGKGADALERRPQLAAALAAARLGRCPGVVGPAFVAGLMAQRVPFIVAEVGADAEPFSYCWRPGTVNAERRRRASKTELSRDGRPLAADSSSTAGTLSSSDRFSSRSRRASRMAFDSGTSSAVGSPCRAITCLP
jgi:hypothetical protein